MPPLKERVFAVLRDPRVARVMRDPRVQEMVVKGFRYRGRVEGAIDRGVQRIAQKLSLATQRDLRGLQRRIRNLERELRETAERLTESEETR